MSYDADYTYKNWRWWLALPVVVPLAILWILAGAVLTTPLWWLGQGLCRISNAIAPTADAPAFSRAVLRWVRKDASQ